jgi:hypothetical protein
MIAPSAPLPCHLSCPHLWQRQELQRKAQNLLRPVLRTTEQYQPLVLRRLAQYLQLALRTTEQYQPLALRTTEQYQPLALRTTEQYLQLVPQRQSPFLPSLWLWLLVLRRQAQFLRQE